MSDRPPIPDLLDRFVLIGQSLMDASAPVDDRGMCHLCYNDLEKIDHDPDCGWQLARKLAPSDLAALRRLARALRYGPSDV
jgi:hypothetical protein